MSQKQYRRLERQGKKIIVPHLGGELTAIHPFLKGAYFQLADQIEEKQRPVMSEASSVLRYGYENEDNIALNMRELIENNYGYFFNGILYIPGKGVYFENDPKFKKGAQTSDDLIMDEKSLELRLGSRKERGVTFSQDGLVRFVPYGFKIGGQTPEELAKNPYVIALAGEEGADNLRYIASKFRGRPSLFVPSVGNQPLKRVAGLNSYRSRDGLLVYGDDLGNNPNGFSFRVVREIFPVEINR